MKLAFADAHRYVSDPASADIDYQDLLSEAYLAERTKRIDLRKAQDPAFGIPRTAAPFT